MQHFQNPLLKLMNIDTEQKRENILVKDLITLATSLIEMNEKEVLEDIFYRPSRQTLTYVILFNESFNSSPIYPQVINHVNIHWKKWTANGVPVNDVLKWKNFSKAEQLVVRQIWSLVTDVSNEKIDLDAILNANHREIQVKLELKEKIVTCLNNYCEHAVDKDRYYAELREWQVRFECESIYSIKMPKLFPNILQFAEKLNSYASVHSWRAFLKRRMTIHGVNKSIDKHQDIDEELSDTVDLSSTVGTASPDNIHVEMTKTTTEPIRSKCVDILQRVSQIFRQFNQELQSICASLNKTPIKNILRLFPEIEQAENDLELLKDLIDVDTRPKLLSIILFWKDHSRIQHIYTGIIQLSRKVSITIDSIWLEDLSSVDQKTSGEKCFLLFDQYQDQIGKRFPENILTLISYYGSSPEFFTFLDSLTADDVDNLKEAVNDWDETLINTKTVFDFDIVKTFLDRAYVVIEAKGKDLKDTPLELDHVVACFTNVWENNQFDDLVKCLESSSLALSSIKRIYLELTDKEQSKRRQIADILQKSTVYFIRVGHHQVTFDVTIELPRQEGNMNSQKKQQKMAFADISELRDRARLLEYSSNVNQKNAPPTDSEREKERLHHFIRFVSFVESTIENLTTLYMMGHPAIPEFLDDQKKFLCVDGIYDHLQENNQILIHLLQGWETKLGTMYEKYTNLTYFSGNQFWEIEDYIYRRSSVVDPGYHLLKFIGIELDFSEKLPAKPINPEDRLENLGKLLSLQGQVSTFKDASPKMKKCLLVETTNEGVLRAILSLFTLTNTFPSVYRIFYCTHHTNWIEVRAFVYRCFYSQSFHQIVRPEFLSQSIQDQFVGLLRSLIEQRADHLFRIGIVTTTVAADQQLINGLQSMKILTILRDHELLDNYTFDITVEPMIRHCRLVTSRITGLGKSSVIRHDIQLSKRNYVKFTISGDLDVDTLAERFRSKYSQFQGGAIHLDIGVVDNSQQLNEVLYCLLFFRSFRFGQVAISIPADTPIYIELDSSPQSTLAELPLVRHIKSFMHIERMDWTILDVGSEIIQVVANYLQTIANTIIIKSNVDPSSFQKNKLDIGTCSRLIQEHFLKNKNADFITWTQLSIFIAVFYRLFTGFSRCGFFLVEYVSDPQVRMDLIGTLLQSSNQFTSLSVESVRKQQRSVAINESVGFSDAIIRWDKIQPFTLILTATNEPLFVYKNPSDVPRALIQYVKIYTTATGQKQEMIETMFPDYNKLTHPDFFIKLALLSKKYLNKSICPKCYRQFEFQIQQCQKCSPKELLIRAQSTDNRDIIKFQMMIAEKLRNEYILTADNFVKMLLIYMRVQCHIPVLIMGETGCGKTALIQFLCEKILDDDLEVFRMHAGVQADLIIKTVQNYAKQAQQCQTENKRLWIFFDEFNTTSNIALLKEIVCERTLLGEPLPVNMVFLGACNPRREKTVKVKLNEDVQIGLRKNRYETQKRLYAGTDRRLLYTVVPIPETMLEYIWDYGYLNESTERAYIKTMLNTCRNLSTDPKLFDLTVDLLVNSHNQFRELEDASSVSLRDIARFCRLYNWFLDFQYQRAGEAAATEKSHPFLRRASLIALLLCYYFRLRSVSLQEIYVNRMQLILAQEYPAVKKVPNYLTEYVLQSEQKDLIDKQMELPEGMAFNRALRNNIFVLFACIVNRIPLFLCGKPGSSKSSAVQILITNLKGKNSKIPYFQTLPELVAVSFQGSQNCTSESIIKVFERAANYTRVKNQLELLPVIVFDEIGLAELSPHNPLKVLHAELEIENNRYGFVGISNWRLDASKMNRALYLSTPDPNVEDLRLTGRTISESMQRQPGGRIVQLDAIIIESLSEAYYDLYKNLRDTQLDHENYFGLRDYYSLIKGIVHALMRKTNDSNIHEIIRRQLKVNFDGVLDGSTLLWQQFCQHIHQEDLFNQYDCPSFDLLLDQNLKSRNGRYLMLIGDSESAIDYVERFINVHQQKVNVRVRTLVGSSFPGDLLAGNTFAEQYNYRVLMDVILYAETNITLIMRQMGHVYDNLYDLFNQNFAVAARKKYCRIALGPLYHPRCLIHDNFYCVVFIHKRDLDKCDPPFLNRFEKHLIDIEALIHPRHKSVINDLHKWLATLLPKNVGKHFPLLQHLFVDYSQDQICNLVIQTFEQMNISINADEQNEKQQNNTIFHFCQTKLLRTSSFDLPLVLSLQPTPDNQELIERYYDLHHSFSFTKLLHQSLEEHTDLAPRLIYTYTQIYHTINRLPENVEEMKLSVFKTELELANRIKRHYQTSANVRLLLIRVDYHSEHQHILSLKHVLLNERVEKSDRGVWIVFHLQRNLLNQTTNDVLFSNWPSEMIDNLNNLVCLSKEILENPSYDLLVHHPEHILSECIFDDLVDRCLAKFRYIVSDRNNEKRINTRRNEVFELIVQPIAQSQAKELHLRSVIENTLFILIQTRKIPDNTRFTDWRLDLLTNGVTIAGSRSFDDALQTTISMFYETYLFVLLAHFEKYHLIDAYSFLSSVPKQNTVEHLSKLWRECLNSSIENIDLTLMHRHIAEIQLVFDLKLPRATTEYENIRKIRELEADNNESFDNSNSVIDRMKSISFYGEDFMELVFTDKEFFRFYFLDQITLHLSETNILLTPTFAFHLLTSNPTRSCEQNARLLLTQHNEFTEILCLFEIGLELISEEEMRNVITKQLVLNPPDRIESTKFYSLVITNSQFYQLPPKTTRIEEDCLFECEGDQMIETSLMNLIELILSPTIIDRTNSIQQITTTYSLIAQGVRDLPSYLVNNLEKLRSFISLIRCLNALLPEKALDVFKDVCRQGFDAKFDSCQTIHRFVGDLHTKIKDERSIVNENIIRRTLTKLEAEFLKDWLADHGDSYGEIFILINEQENDLWQYSAKIFTYIDRKLDLFSTLKENYGKIPSTEEYEQFKYSLKVGNTTTLKVERLLLNRFHMHLMRNASGDEIDQQLTEYYPYFEENLREIGVTETAVHLQFISIFAWMKYYTQIYAFALNQDSRIDVLHRIDQLLTNSNTPICSTLKLFVFKQLLQISGLTLNGIRELYVNRNIIWIKSFIQRSRDQQGQNIRRNLILPTPLFECREEFQRISQILNEAGKGTNELRQITRQCATSQKLSYAYLSWFIQYYCRFLQANTESDQIFIQLIEQDLRSDLIYSFTPVGHNFVASLSNNFSNNSYFRLQSTMEPNDVHKRLLALNLVAVFISFRSVGEITLLGNILFNDHREMPQNYLKHLSTICLPGMTVSDPVITQLMDVRAQVQGRLSRGIIHRGGKFIFQCSDNCPWVFIFHDCGVPNDRNLCVLCKKPIGAQRYGVLIERDPPQIRIPIAEGLRMINQRIDQYNQTVRLGYHQVKTCETSQIVEKPEHLNRPVSFRFVHLVTHGLLLFLHDRQYLSNNDLQERLHLRTTTHFRDHFEKDYLLLSQSLTDDQQCYIWLYKLFNHLLNETFSRRGRMNTNAQIIEAEQMLEQQLIFPHIDSVSNEIGEYKKAYAQLNQERDSKPSLDHFIDELFEDENEYPQLNLFNVTTFHTSNLLDQFILKMGTLPDAERSYPLTTFLFKRFDEYLNIQYLYSIVVFTNYLIEKLNHRIKRNDAAERKIEYYLREDNDQHVMQQLYEQFLHSWYSLNLKEVRYGCQTSRFQLTLPKEKFAEHTSIATLLLNTSKDASSLLLAATLKTIAELQNELVNYFHNTLEHLTENRTRKKQIPLQSIRAENVFHLDRKDVSQKLVDDSLVLNYQYGKGRDIIYDYEEIEMTLRNEISSLVLIDTEKLRFLNYQFELYGENSSLINDVRARIKQQQLPNDEQTKLQTLLRGMNNDDILNYLGSIDYVFTYLRNSVPPNATETTIIQTFVERHTHSNACLHDNLLRRPPFSTIQLQFIIHLYEMIEETAFDQVLRAYVKRELLEETFSDEERERVLHVFSRMTFKKENIAETLKSIENWISMLKRLMIRVLNANIDLQIPLHLYLQRTDLWSDRVTVNDLATLDDDDHILLGHTYVILRGLEKQLLNKKSTVQNPHIQSVDEQRQRVETWFTTIAKSTTTPRQIVVNKGSKAKIRV